jgi:hypothetical protein
MADAVTPAPKRRSNFARNAFIAFIGAGAL